MEDNDCVDRHFANMKNILKSPIEKARHNICRAFVNNEPSSISVGCGGYEPVIIGTQFASDISPRAEKYLKSVGFTGEFHQSDIRSLHFQNKQFKVAICSEVIEHLAAEGDVVLAFAELNRISESWLVTTPCKNCSDPDHKFLFTEEQLKRLFAPHDYKIFIYRYFFYITNDANKLSKIIPKR